MAIASITWTCISSRVGGAHRTNNRLLADLSKAHVEVHMCSVCAELKAMSGISFHGISSVHVQKCN